MQSMCSLAFVFVTFSSSVFAQRPTSYCTAGTSTNGCTPSITANVQPNTANDAGCVITTSGIEGQKQGLVFYGVDNSAFTPSPWGAGSTSFRCVKPPTARIGALLNSGGTAGQCDGSFVLDWDAFQTSHPNALGNPWIVADNVFVQSWYRDPLAVKTSNLSDALELTFRFPAPIVPVMVPIASGTFQMGSDPACGYPYWECSNGLPLHSVTITYAFWMAQTEVTQAQYASLTGSSPSSFPGAEHPVDSVSWFDAQAYCATLTTQQSALGNVPVGYQYRLPTEAEWEYACRAGTTTHFNVGEELFCGQARFQYSNHSNSACWIGPWPGAVPVRSYAPNAWGLYDMHGNVSEWCLDSWAIYPNGAVTDPFVTGPPDRINRGGNWWYSSDGCRSANRGSDIPGAVRNYVGFRVVLAPILVP